MKIRLEDPVVVAQAANEQPTWGVWQFPTLNRMGDRLLVSYSRAPDLYLDSADDYAACGLAASDDGGRTWQPYPPDRPYAFLEDWLVRDRDSIWLQGPGRRDMLKADLPEPVGRVSDGYHGHRAVRDPLQMPAGFESWQRLRYAPDDGRWHADPASVQDPDAAVASYDPPGRPYTTVYPRWCTHLLELPDTSLLAVFYGHRLDSRRKPHPKYESWCLRSVDDGLTWAFHGVIARDDHHPLAGYSETAVTVLRDGSLFAVMRTECAQPGGPARTRSRDGGRTWDPPEPFQALGVYPRFLALENGARVLSFGRPGVFLLFSGDGRAETWENRIPLVEEDPEDATGPFAPGTEHLARTQRCSGHSQLVATGPDSFLVVYDQFDYPNPAGEPRKTILVRECKVELAPRPAGEEPDV